METKDDGAPRVRADIDAIAIWEPTAHADADEPAKVLGLSLQSWDFRAQSGTSGPCVLVVTQDPQEYQLADGSHVVVRNAKEWTVEARYVETRDFPAPDGSPRPKHFFEADVPEDLVERLRSSPEDILGKSDLYDASSQ